VDARILADLLREQLQESSAVKYVRNLPGMGPILPALVTEIDGQRLVFREPGSVLHGCVSHRLLMQRARLSNSGENGTSFWLAHWSVKRNLDACVVQKTPLHHGD
jgi:hypothetical protein